MSETFRGTHGRKTVSRDSAEDLGTVSNFVLDLPGATITALVVGHGRKGRLVDWGHITGFGPDAIMVDDDSAVRDPADDRESLSAEGKLELVGRRALTEMGNDLGDVDDVLFDPEKGTILTVMIGEREVPGSALVSLGSYAVIVSADQDDSTSA